MSTEFAFLATLTLNSDEREALRIEINNWVKFFLRKLERESTRTAKCRLIASVERHEFGDNLGSEKWQFGVGFSDTDSAENWRSFKFVGNEGVIFCIFGEFGQRIYNVGKFKATTFQKKILSENPSLKNISIGRSEIKEESGEWKLDNELKAKLISEGGEAIVLDWKFGEHEMAVWIQVFDAFLFTKKFVGGEIKWKTHLISG